MADVSERQVTSATGGETGEKPTCGLCWSTFETPTELQRHCLFECLNDDIDSSASTNHHNSRVRHQPPLQASSGGVSPPPTSSSPEVSIIAKDDDDMDEEQPLEEDAEPEEDEESSPTTSRNEDGKLVYHCDLCPKTFTNYGSYRRHLRMHSYGHRYTCEVCGKQFFRRYLWLKHYEKIHNSTVMKMCRCTICNTWLKNPDTLKEHIRTKHKNKRSSPPASNVVSTVAPPLTETIVLDSTSLKDIISSQQIKQQTNQVVLQPKTFSCDICSQNFATRALWATHMDDAHNKRSKANDEVASSAVASPSGSSGGGFDEKRGVFICDECQKTFINRSSYLRHKKMHTGVRPYTCELCCRSFFRSESLTTHKRKHAPNDPFQCYVCSHIAEGRDSLATHFITVHSKQPEEFDVNSLPKSTVNNKNVRGRPTRNGVPPPVKEPEVVSQIPPPSEAFRCSVCSRTFSTAQEYGQHTCETVSSETFSCKLCSCTLPSKAQFHEHVLSHVDESGFICHKCGCFFLNEEDQFDHQETEHIADDEHFCCIYCDVAFSNSIQLQDHVKRDHLDMYVECALMSNGVAHVQKTIQDFKCDWCNVIFDSYKSCTNHFRQAHSIMTIQNTAVSGPALCKQCSRPLLNSEALSTDRLCDSCASEEWYRCNVCRMTGPQTVVEAHMRRAHMTKITAALPPDHAASTTTSQNDPLFCNLKRYIDDVVLGAPPVRESTASSSSSPHAVEGGANGESNGSGGGDSRILRALFSMAKSPLDEDSGGEEEGSSDADTVSNVMVKKKCDECDKVFTHLNSWKRHKRMHLGINKLTCPKCSRDFYRRDQYRKHLATHASDSATA